MKVIIQSLVAAVTFCVAPLSCPAAESDAQSATSKAPVATTIAQADSRFASTPSVSSNAAVTPEEADPGRRGARAAARQGPDALRRYVDRTRAIYALDIYEFKVSQP